MSVFAALLLAVGLAGTAPVIERAEPERIQIETDAGYCWGDCDWYRIEVRSNGKATVWVYHNEDLVRRRWRTLTPQEFAAFEARLAPYRPVGDLFIDDDRDHCEKVATDMGGYHVQWDGRGSRSRLALNDGCIGKAVEPMRAALDSAVNSLGFHYLPGASANVMATTMMPPR
jgi:hypothetical protein